MTEFYSLRKDGTQEGHNDMKRWHTEKWSGVDMCGPFHLVTQLPGDRLVSTVFMGLDYNFGVGVPITFESMVFAAPVPDDILGTHRPDLFMVRYPTKVAAIRGHIKLVQLWGGYRRFSSGRGQ